MQKFMMQEKCCDPNAYLQRKPNKPCLIRAVRVIIDKMCGLAMPSMRRVIRKRIFMKLSDFLKKRESGAVL